MKFNQNKKEFINSDALINDLTNLYIGQPIVHTEYGIGRYAGVTTLETGGNKSEYLILTYANDSKLYVPVSSLHLINRYISVTGKKAPLHKLGCDSWIRAKQKAAKKACDIAAKLLNIYAQRIIKKGFAFSYDNKKYQLFCDKFPFEITLEQGQAINDVINDMCKSSAMDRLVCGDVGFGKTEVAMRAAFIAVTNKKQVAVLVPTTLLAQQHFDNFRDRFTNWSINIEMLSRFCNKKKQLNILQEVKEGKINILIGTHKILQNNLKWNDLGLLIIDEEHRFGVQHKEYIKLIRSNIDILTLTATPIPRTLSMAISKIRDISIINTPPTGRLAVKTFVFEYNSSIVRKAILHEIMRGGQVYYLYNNVKNIQKKANKLATLVPEANITVGHGRMYSYKLEQIMKDFHLQRFNVLVCTTIIETGIDIPTANTIIIERADNFGLAQLHQLRGRVGRSSNQAYAWLLTPNFKSMTLDAKKRLEAISSLEDLGVGFTLSTHDLEIRGAGDLLGKNQSGSIETVGLSLYMHLLENAIHSLKLEQEPIIKDIVDTQQIEIKLRVPSLLPKDFISDTNIRLSFYKRIAIAKNESDLEKIKVELINRFGLLPEATHNLIDIANMRQKAKKLGICKLEGNKYGGFFEFNKKNRINPMWIINLLQNEPQSFFLDGSNRLNFVLDLIENKQRIDWIKKFMIQMEDNIEQ